MLTGSCLCGGVRFEVAKVPLILLCHCSICRKSSGSAFAAGAAVQLDDFRLTAGSDLVQHFESSPDVERSFCRVCGSRVPSKARGGRGYFVPAGLLDGDPGVKPALHIFAGSRAPWWEIRDDCPQFEKWIPGYSPEDSR